MRADLPDVIAAAVARCERPTLLFDRARLESNARAIAEAAAASAVTVLFAVKSFPHVAVREIAAQHFAGFDVASVGELEDVGPLRAARAGQTARIVSIADPTARAGGALGGAHGRVIVDCETVDQVRAVPPGAEIALRVSASVTGRDPAIGAVLDGTGHRRSRFGIERADELALLVGAATGAGSAQRRIGLHVHHGPVTATSADRFVATARAVLALARTAGLEPAFLNLGGAWHGIVDLAAALAALRAEVGPLELLIEPGRALSAGAGFATGTIVSSRSLGDRELRIADLSRICHLRWSPIDLVGPAPHPGTGVKTLVVGPTCFEDDALGEWTLPPGHLAPGSRLVLRDVTGYALAWNTGFAGVRPADILIV